MPEKIKLLQQELKKKKLSAFLITKPENVFYLTGFKGSFGMILLTPSKCTLITDSRYLLRAQKEIDTRHIQIANIADGQRLIKKYKTIGYEDSFVTVARLKYMKKNYPKASWKPFPNAVEKLRIIKTAKEIKLMQKASQMGDAIFQEIKNSLSVGVTEKEIEWQILELIRLMGGEGASFDPIVAFHTHGAIPHHEVTDRKLKKGDSILLDFGVKYKGYCSDMTRMLYTAKPTAKQARIHNLVLEAQEAGVHAVKAGIKTANLDAVSRDIIADRGFGDHFGHSLGHGVGGEIHEAPNISTRSKEKLEAGMVITIEPGIYLPRWGGVRIEDMVVVTEKGCKVLTKTSKKLEDSIITLR